MKKLDFTSAICITLAGLTLNANAKISTNYQSGHIENYPIALKINSLTNDAIILNTRIDDIDIRDPRIKSIIEYVKDNGNGVSVVFFAPNNLRYVKKVNKLFQENQIFTDMPQLATPKHLIDLDLIKIYVIKEQHNANRSQS